MSKALFDSQISNLEMIYRGKVRDVYAIDDQHMLIVTTDRLSAFDVILPDAIPGKGEVLTEVAKFWFKRSAGTIKNHLAELSLEEVVPDSSERAVLGKRTMLVKKLKALPIEAIVRGYLIGSGWKDYQATSAVCGIDLPKGLQLASQLPEVIYTPSSKAEVGDHDENIDYAKTIELVGEKLAAQIKEVSIRLYKEAAEYALARGIIIADTKFEFGLDENNELVLMDEILTPDSSRFWPAESYQVGTSPASFDKQFVRDYLETLDWDKADPGPRLPAEIIAATAAKYAEAQEKLTVVV
jgi:phosphoribosylaminoimidazole-succinocarboxamide synthase